MDTLENPSVCSYTEVKEAVRFVRATSARKQAKDDEWYRLDRYDASLYFEPFPKWERKIIIYFETLREAGKQVTYVDICGRAAGKSLGADQSYSFSIQPLDHLLLPLWKEGTRGTEGDLFNGRDFSKFINLLRTQGVRPALVTFEPNAGLQGYTPVKGSAKMPRLHSEVTFQLLEHNLRKMVGILQGGGFILLGPPFQFSDDIRDFWEGRSQEEYQSSRWIRNLCTELGCWVEVGPTLFGPRWLIRKRGRA